MKKINIFLLLICGFGIGVLSILIANYITNWFVSDKVYSTNIADHENTITQNISNKIKTINNKDNLYKKFDQIKYILDTQMYNESWTNYTWMINGALHGFVWWAWDDHTTYFDAEESVDFSKDIWWSQDFEGIWAYIAKKSDIFVVQEVVKWSPAYNSWIKTDDIILEIWDQKLKSIMTTTQIVKMIRWPKNTIIKITIYRPSTKTIIKFEITRGKINVSSVSSKLITHKWKNLWYINISTIWEDTYNNFVTQLKDLKTSWINWIILDLRWDGWWLVPVASEIMSNWVETWQLLMNARYRAFSDENYYSSWYGLAQWIPTVILVDEITASASEIIAWWLRDIIWIKLIWAQTYGKWSIQTIQNFEDWSAMKYTIWKRYLPNGKNIDWIWLTPNIEVKFDSELYKKTLIDNQLERAKEELIK